MNSNEAFAKEDELDLTERRIEISVDDPGEPENPPENLTRNDGQTETQNDQNYSTQIASEPVIFVENEMNRPTTVRFDVGTDEPDRPDFKIRKASTVDQLASTITGICFILTRADNICPNLKIILFKTLEIILKLLLSAENGGKPLIFY